MRVYLLMVDDKTEPGAPSPTNENGNEYQPASVAGVYSSMERAEMAREAYPDDEGTSIMEMEVDAAPCA